MTTDSTTKNKIFLYVTGSVLVLAFFCWTFWQTIGDLVQTWSTNEDYSHGFLIIPIALYLIFQKRPWPKLAPPTLSWLGMTVVVAGLAASLIGALSQFRTLANISFIVTIWGSLVYLFGYRIIKYFGWELFLLIFMLPVPSRLYACLSSSLLLKCLSLSCNYWTSQFTGTAMFSI